MGFSLRSIVRWMPMIFSATLIMIPSLYVMPYATPLGGRLARNVLVLVRRLSRPQPRSMMVILEGTGDTLYRVKTIRIAAISVMIILVNCFTLLVFSCALLLSLKDRSDMRPLR